MALVPNKLTKLKVYTDVPIAALELGDAYTRHVPAIAAATAAHLWDTPRNRGL
jgi:hypothetical protein